MITRPATQAQPARPASPAWLWTMIGVVALACLATYYSYAARAKKEEEGRAIHEERMKRKYSEIMQKEQAEKLAAAEEAGDPKRKAALQLEASIIKENTQRALDGKTLFVCRLCLGKGLFESKDGPKPCPECKGKGETR